MFLRALELGYWKALTPAFGNRAGLWRLVALSGGVPVQVFGECGHRGFTPLTAWPAGPGQAVSLN